MNTTTGCNQDENMAAPEIGIEPLLTPEEAAELLSVKPKTLTWWRCKGRYGLKYVKVGRFVRYRLSDLRDFVNAAPLYNQENKQEAEYA